MEINKNADRVLILSALMFYTNLPYFDADIGKW